MHVRSLLALFAAGLMSACTWLESDSGPRTPVPEGGCGASRVQAFEGRVLNDDVRARIAEKSGAESIRIMRPGRAYTMEYLAGRLSVRIDEDGRITSLNCG